MMLFTKGAPRYNYLTVNKLINYISGCDFVPWFSQIKQEVLKIMERITGTVKWFSNERGYGFVLVDNDPNEKEYFVHYSYITMEGYKTLRAGQKVSFVLTDTDRGVQAHDVQFAG